MAVSDQADFYLKPTGLLSGAAADKACAEGVAARLAGGAIAFNSCELIRRKGGERRTDIIAVDGLRVRTLRSDAVLAEAIEERLAAISAPRPPFAGLALDRPRIMGVINVTPDSFSDGGRHAGRAPAVAHGQALLAAGADIIDIGGESTRPGAAPVSPQEELDRVIPVVGDLAAAGALVSVDTRHAAVMARALEAGARIVNDVTALTGDPASLDVVARAGAAVVLMHMRGDPRSMQHDPVYDDAPLDIHDYFAGRLAACVAAGIGPDRVALDPGIGFGKRDPHNLAILADLAVFHGLGCALLVGASRKGFIGRLSRGEDADHRLPGSLAAALTSLERGAQIIRVHDVAETTQAFSIWRAVACV